MRLSIVVFLLMSFGNIVGSERNPLSFEEVSIHTLLFLIRNDDVRAEIQPTKPQDAKLTQAIEAIRARFTERADSLRKMTREEAKPGFAKLQAETMAEIIEAIKTSHTTEQLARLRQIELQSMGYALSLSDPEVQKLLELTLEQKKKLAELLEENELKRSKLTRAAKGIETKRTIPDSDFLYPGLVPTSDRTVIRLRQELNLSAKLLLSTKQLDSWYGLIGKPFPAPKASK